MDKRSVELLLNSIGIPNFQKLMEFIESSSLDEIAEKITSLMNYDPKIPQDTKNNHYLGMSLGCFKSQFVGAATVRDAIMDIKKNSQNYKWMYSILGDEPSKDTLFHILLYRIFRDKIFLSLCYDSSMQYFDMSLFPSVGNEVFVDCGACFGENTIEFIEKYPNYKKVYTYEPAPRNFKTMVDNVSSYNGIENMNKALSDTVGTCSFTSHMPDSANRINPHGDVVVEVSTIDIDIKEPVTLIKMDIESAEPNALLGAKNHIINDKPYLAICVYHTIKDIWTIPQIIYSMNPHQTFFLKHHAEDKPEETVLYVVPHSRERKEIDVKGIIDNIDLMRDVLKTVEEGLNYTKQVLTAKDTQAANVMLNDVKQAFLSCINYIDTIQKDI